ncbi:hypothetical protein [Acinetobacter proteolyticus]|uniref:Uncharacterized protein n=1 Tax=Acinetobacter proteolyticus TaxID=1776741 RepID=A0A2N0WIB1_9GAMM|nr:hypothetical protein [Acinetobacter proteolyticus]PKF35538.1 hypothetical protein CW311_04410 [Acinetobacter proteolyticus]
MKYFLNTETNEVHAFKIDGSQDDFITDKMNQMNALEIDKHLHPEKYLSDEEKEQYRLNQYPLLDQRQFKLCLTHNDLIDQLEDGIAAIEDRKTRRLMQIEYDTAERFERTGRAILDMFGLLNMPSQKIDDFWEQALKL